MDASTTVSSKTENRVRPAKPFGAIALDRMKNGMELESTLMRRGLPFDVNEHSHLASDWIQVSQRVSQSENGLARWEVVGATKDLVSQAKREIAACVSRFGAGEEYQGSWPWGRSR